MSSTDLQPYLTAIGRYPVLCKETQLRHCQRIHAWVNWPGGRDQAPPRVRRTGQRSMEAMIVTNTRLVVSIAKRYQNRGMELLDLIQEGNLGLVRGLELYDPTRGYAVSTYCFWWVRQAVTRALSAYARPIRLPVSTYETLTRAHRHVADRTAATGIPPRLEETAAHCKTDPERLRIMLDLHAITACGSLDALATEDGNPLVDLIGADPTEAAHDSIQNDSDIEALHTALANLPTAEARVLTGVFFDEQTLSSLAPEIGVSRSRAGQLQKSGLTRLRSALEAGVA